MHTYRPPTSLISTVLAIGTVVATALPSWSQVQVSQILSSIPGMVAVGGQTFEPAFNGRVVFGSDRIRVGANSQVILLCSNGSTYPLSCVNADAVSDYYLAQRARTRRPSTMMNPTRDPFRADLPYVVSPRNTALLDATQPITLQWNPIANASTYEVTVTGQGVDWSTTVSEQRALYTGPELQPDYRYTIVVTADNGLSTAAESSVGFTVSPAAETVRMRSQVAQIQSQQLEPDAEAIALASAYLSYEHSDPERRGYPLYQAALEVLDKRIQAGSQNSQIYLLQADTFLTTGLPLQARERYQQALALAQKENQRSLQAESNLGLANVAEGQTEYGDAISYLRAAQVLYQNLENAEQVEVLQARIRYLESQ